MGPSVPLEHPIFRVMFGPIAEFSPAGASVNEGRCAGGGAKVAGDSSSTASTPLLHARRAPARGSSRRHLFPKVILFYPLPSFHFSILVFYRVSSSIVGNVGGDECLL